jgi:hypothetical protein
MAHVASIGLFPPSWYPRYGHTDGDIFHKVATIPTDIVRRGMSFTPKEFADLYWNCRRLKVEYTIHQNFRQSNGSAYSVADPVTKSYVVPMLRRATTGTTVAASQAQLLKYQERNLLGYFTGSVMSWPGQSVRWYSPENSMGSPQPIYNRFRARVFFFDSFVAGQLGVLHTEPIIPDNYAKPILWPMIEVEVGLVGQHNSIYTISLPDGIDPTHYEQRGLCHFLDYPAVPLFKIWDGTSTPSQFFAQDQGTANITISWPDTTEQEKAIHRWPYADRTDGKYQDGLDGDPDELGNW